MTSGNHFPAKSASRSSCLQTVALLLITALIFLWPVFLASGQSSDYYYVGSGIGDDPALGDSDDDTFDDDEDDDDSSGGGSGGCDYYYVGSGLCDDDGDRDGDGDENDDDDSSGGGSGGCDYYYVGSGLCDDDGDDEDDGDGDDEDDEIPEDCDFYYVGSGLCDGDDVDDEDGDDEDEDEDDTFTECPLPGTDLSDITNFPPPSGPIVAFGNSLTTGVGASPGEDYVSELEEELSINIINEGVPGDTTADARMRLDEDVLSRDPSVVIVWLGGNDELRRIYELLQDTSEFTELEDELDELVDELDLESVEDMPLLSREETFENIKIIIEAIQDTGAITILIGFDPVLYDPSIADNYEDIAEDTGSIFVPDIYDDIFGRSSRMSDLIHPNDAGYDIIADRIEPALRCALPNR